ncbi:MAG: HAD family hydrolase, partial [Clostridia bacterium]|nr:HAD family hydrolase [Clostridia bacterium]
MNEKFEQVKCFLLDMDGTIYLDNEVIDGAIDAVNRMRKKGKVIFLTNNSSRSKDAYVERLGKLGFNATDDEVFTSGNATAEYLNTFYKNKKIFLFGTESLANEFREAGITLTDERPDLIVLAFDITFDYDRLEL